MIKQTKNIVFIVLGSLCLVIGIIGIFLPLLPTTPLAILAAYFYSKGSPRLHRWLLGTKTLGPLIQDWENHGVIRPGAKVLSTVMIVVLFSFTVVFVDVSVYIKAVVVLIGVGVLAFILSRPSRVEEGDGK